MEDDMLIQMKAAYERFNRIAKKKKAIEENKLDNRPDVQTLRRKIALLNQDLIYSKQDMENTKEAYDKAKCIFDKQTEQHKQFVAHLSIISKNHKEQQQKQLDQLLKMMKGSDQQQQTLSVLDQGTRLDRVVDNVDSGQTRNPTVPSKVQPLPGESSGE